MLHQKNKRTGAALAVLAGILFFITLLLVFVFGTSRIASTGQSEEARITKEAIERATVLCYATEGYYPPGLSYIEENYGVQVNHSRFVVEYNVFASNILPSITVMEKPTIK